MRLRSRVTEALRRDDVGGVLGSLLLGGAVGVLLAQGWSRGPADG